MTWAYRQSTGELSRNGQREGVGYSGHEDGLNNPAMEADQGVGPLPAGRWKIGPVEAEHPHLGPVVMSLSPVGHDAHGRSAFFIHGDNAKGDHSASHGCIILARTLRQMIADSGDRNLVVEA